MREDAISLKSFTACANISSEDSFQHKMEHCTIRDGCDLSSSHEDRHSPSAQESGRNIEARNHFNGVPSSRETGTITEAQHALSVYEILEHILSQLPFLDLYMAQRVSRRWYEIIKRSEDIQQRMFLQTTEAPLLPLTGLPTYSDRPPWSARYDEHRSPCQTVFQTPALAINAVAYLVPSYHEEGPQAWITNAWPGSRKPVVEMEIGATIPGFTQLSSDYIRFDLKSFTVPRGDQDQATWRKSLLTEPPITAVEFFSVDWREGGDEHYRMNNLNGVTLGDLQEWEEMFRKKHGLRFGGKCLGHSAACGFWIKRLGTNQCLDDS